MPYKYEWVDAEEVLFYKNTSVYYTYKNDEPEQGTFEYWYTLDPSSSAEDREDFDIRELCQQLNLPCDKLVVASVLRQAIDAGLIQKEEP